MTVFLQRCREGGTLSVSALARSNHAAHLDLHLGGVVVGNHKHPKVQRGFAHHPRLHIHFTPTSASWLNMVERFFRALTQNRLRCGVFRDLEELILAIGDYIDRHNDHPEPFIWAARAADILERSSALAARWIKGQSV